MIVATTGAEVHDPVLFVTVIFVVSPPPPDAAVSTPVPDTIVAAVVRLELHDEVPAPPVLAIVMVLPGDAVHKLGGVVVIVGVTLTVTTEVIAKGTEQLPNVAVKVNAPVVTAVAVGLKEVEVNPEGPVQL